MSNVPTQWREKIKFRRQHVKDVCRKFNLSYSLDGRDPNFMNRIAGSLGNLLVVEKSKFAFCYVPKIANTNWKRTLLALAGALSANDIRRVQAKDVHYDLAAKYIKPLNQYSVADRKHILENYKTAMFFRNPLERLLSVYRNKIENKPYEHPEILSLVGNYVMSRFLGLKPGFPIRIERQKEKILGQMPSGETFEADLKNIPDLFPNIDIRFDEFLRYIIEHPSKINSHWAPPYTACFPCQIDYDFIGSFDTLAEDAENILRILNADPGLKFPQEAEGKIRTVSLMQDYYHNISKSSLAQLQQQYRIDIEMSNFTDIQ
ncbi:carbohydrate sulfotransferase 11-like [Lingula anatina]|uniref:Carbohydrate sulfotransferase n=1 Tax=Lingula anatina TaxID=7574 RepID=A0A1S3I792_LINAN|nr:carbohydrate sulfotransferase 11-like [Lingula anatina]|eukprot:XP_013393239.1 carbohydrate sulfotransferase 11-like [Lingula anatina]